MIATRTEGAPPTKARTAPAPEARARRIRTPRIDVVETAEAFRLTADLPGAPMEAIDITLEENRLELRALRSGTSREGKTAAGRPSADTEYRRSFRIPADVDRAQIQANLRDGVLRITLPKAPSARPQRIEVRAA